MTANVRLPPELEKKLRQIAARKGQTLSAVYRQAFQEYFERELTDEKTPKDNDGLKGVTPCP